MDQQDQYGMADLRNYMNGMRPLFPPIPPPPDLLSAAHHHHHHHRSLTTPAHYEMVLVGRHQVTDNMLNPAGVHHHAADFRSDSTTSAAPGTTTTTSCGRGGGFVGLEMEVVGGGDGGTGRWPRQETLSLLEIRSRLDPKFKEANQKGPLWDEVSRIMSEEHGHQRSGKKCREKFENLYKYYKKTKEGKAGRQDGKHYRFFRQLEALYGDTTTSNCNAPSVSENNHHLLGTTTFPYTTTVSNQEPASSFQAAAPKPSDSLSPMTNSSSDFDSTSSEDSDLNVTTADNDSNEKRKKRSKGSRRSWKAKIKDFIDLQMRKLMEKQEAWLDKMVRTIEQKEQERMLKEEEWRKQGAARMDREHNFWANERAWIEARDATLMDNLRKLTGKELVKPTSWELMAAAEIQSTNVSKNQNHNMNGSDNSWAEFEITRLIQLRTGMETKFEQIVGGCPEEVLWEEIASKMACLGYDRSALMCKDKWNSISNYLIKCSKKRKENSRVCCNYQLTNESINGQEGNYSSSDDQGPDQTGIRHAPNDQGRANSPSNSHGTGNAMQDGCYRYLLGDAHENLWENYGVKFSKGEN